MSDHVALAVDWMGRPESPADQTVVEVAAEGPTSTLNETSKSLAYQKEGEGEGEEEQPLIQAAECRICQEEDSVNNLETPCICSGSLKYAHQKCVQQWCNEKGDTTCEICHQPYQPGYTAPPRPPHSEDTVIDFGRGWTLSGTPGDLRDPHLVAIAEAEQHFLQSEYDEYTASNACGAAFCRSAALVLMVLLLLRHVLNITYGDADDDVSRFFSVFLLRAAGFLLPCYIVAWTINNLQQRRQRQEAAALAATQVAFVLQSGQHRDLQFTIAGGPAATSHQEPV